jgi:hypothetical protein
MATAAPHVKLLRQLASAKDEYLSGALDLAWDGGASTIFLVFGQPAHLVFEADGQQLEGEDALTALARALPRDFSVGDWRRTMSPAETLHCSIDDLAEPFAELAGASVDTQDGDGDAVWLDEDDDSPDFGFGLADFPLLPEGDALWPEGPVEELGLAGRLAELPAALVTLTGPRLHAAGVVAGGKLIDAVWVDADDHVRGDTAQMAILGAPHGSLAGHRLDSEDVSEALPMLWRLRAGEPIDLAWLDPAGFAAALSQDPVDRAVIIDAAVRGVALFRKGVLVGVYSTEQRTPSRSAQALLDLLAQPQGTVSVRQRSGAPRARRVHSEPAAAPPPPQPGPPTGDLAAAVVNGGSESLVDFDDVKRELVGIGVEWLGERDSAPVTQLIEGTRPTIEDFVATIDAIRTLSLPGHDPAAVTSMARQMHHQAAERLCGA